jgi:uncharacterized membrane protein
MAAVSGTQLIRADQQGDSRRNDTKTSAKSCNSCVNVGESERQISLAAGAVAALAGLARRDVPGLLVAAVGAGLIYRGATGHCHAYDALGIDTSAEGTVPTQRRLAREKNAGVHVSKSILIDMPPLDLYTFWRKLENLPQIMSHLKSVDVIDERRSHWVAQAPIIAGGSVEWDAEIIEDRPSERIAWRSLPASGIANRGSVEFKKAPGNRGTYIKVELEYSPPGGKLGGVLTRLFGDNPETTVREDLRRFKRTMEVGEVLTIKGQPRGSCFAGVGRLMS